jgi:spore germination cell wall hydrolase CwlJ-like protein
MVYNVIKLNEMRKNKMLRKSEKKLLLKLLAILSFIALIIAAIISKVHMKEINYQIEISELQLKIEEYREIEINKILSEKQQEAEVAKENELNKTNILKLTDKQRELVIRTLAAECRGEGLAGQLGCAQVMRDRSLNWDIPIDQILSAPYQFAKPFNGTITNREQLELVVELVFDNGYGAFKEDTTHFYEATKCNPSWASYKTQIAVIGNHRFMG